MDYDIVEEAKNIIYNSQIMLYVKPEKIEEAFQKIYVFKDKNKFLEAYGRSDFDSERLEGFNRASGSYLGPDATVHTVIHEVLHEISSVFDRQGHRIVNGIVGDENLRFANQVNEGLTDYLAAKLSGELPRHYIRGHKLFMRLEPMFIKYTGEPNALLKIYLDNDVQSLQKFLDYYGKPNTFENLYNKFLFMKNEDLDNMLQDVEKNLNKDIKKEKRRKRINNIINRIFYNKTKLLTDGRKNVQQNDKINKTNTHEQFVSQYDISNFEYNRKKEDEKYYKQHRQNMQKDNLDNER